MTPARWTLFAFLIISLVLTSQCKLFESIFAKKTTVKNFINWNLVFNDQLSHAQRDSLATTIVQRINAVTDKYPITGTDTFATYFNYGFYNLLKAEAKGRPFRLHAAASYCHCHDSLLWNLHADLQIDGSGESVPVVRKPKGTTLQGGIAYLSYNSSSGIPALQGSVLNPQGRLSFTEVSVIDTSGIISVIDTGIDTLKLDARARRAIMPFGEHGSQNVMMNANPDEYADANAVRHGTSVTAIILKEYYRLDAARRLPRIMSLKALDDSGAGDIFSMSCAILQSIEARAKLINISAGYYGEEDTVLNHFLHLSKQANIPVIAAAGNFRGSLSDDVCRSDANKQALLGNALMFYPACVSPDTTRYWVISVTGLKEPYVPCYYQNYSAEYVTVGVINKALDTCCVFQLPFFKNGVGLEGTSFATPVVSGRLGHALMNGATASSYSGFTRPPMNRTAAVAGPIPTKFTLTH